MQKMKLIFYLDQHCRNPVEKFIESLSDQASRKVARGIQPLAEFGMGTHIKDVKKIIGTTLWEVRILGKDSIRIIYTSVVQNKILLLHGFIKKSQKTPEKEILIALKRLSDWKSRN